MNRYRKRALRNVENRSVAWVNLLQLHRVSEPRVACRLRLRSLGTVLPDRDRTELLDRRVCRLGCHRGRHPHNTIGRHEGLRRHRRGGVADGRPARRLSEGSRMNRTRLGCYRRWRRCILSGSGPVGCIRAAVICNCLARDSCSGHRPGRLRHSFADKRAAAGRIVADRIYATEERRVQPPARGFSWY